MCKKSFMNEDMTVFYSKKENTNVRYEHNVALLRTRFFKITIINKPIYQWKALSM